MRQRGVLWLTLLPYLLGTVAAAGVVGWGYWQATNWCNRACTTATERADAAEARIVEAQERATALALLWADAVQRVEVKYVEVVKWRTNTVVRWRERAASAGFAGSIQLAPDARGLLGDVARDANAPGPAAGGEVAPAPVPEAAGQSVTTSAQDWAAFAIDAAAAYSEAADKHRACVEWVGKIREAGQ